MNTKGYYLALFIDGEFDHVLVTSNDFEELKLLRNALVEKTLELENRGSYHKYQYKNEKIQQFYNEAQLIKED